MNRNRILYHEYNHIGEQCDMHSLFDACNKIFVCDRILFVVRKRWENKTWVSDSPGIVSAIEKYFSGELIDRFCANEWPGTKLLANDQCGEVFVLNYNCELQNKLADLEPDFWKWLNYGECPLPEDLCLFGKDADSPELISVTHEKSLWIKKQFENQWLIESYKSVVDMKDFVPAGRYFCKHMQM